jgi:hypothetical protein
MAKKSKQAKFKKKCDVLITSYFKGKPCVVCKTKVGTAGHHLISRNNAYARHKLLNLLPLCPKHHLFSNSIAAHSSNFFAQKKFADFVKTNFPEHYKFWKENQHKIGVKMDWEEVYYNELKEKLEELK